LLTAYSYTNTPKYRCPRCPGPVRTCSLPCYKRHQQRASCNGQRDPTAYVKKSQLATPAGIDHDYNFLTKIERVVDRPDDDRDREFANARKRWHAEGPLQKYLRDNRVRVDRAPVGMSRQKTNQTRFLPKSKRIVWTVEWVDTDGSRRHAEVHEAETLGSAYQAMSTARGRESNKKRKLDTTDDIASSHSKNINRHASGHVSGDIQDSAASSVMATIPKEETVLSGDSHVAADVLHTSNDSNEARPTLYLLRPHTASSSHVLIPASPTLTLTAILRDRAVLEFPTIYAMNHSPDAVPDGFITEQAWLDARKEEDAELEGLLQAAPDVGRKSYEGRLYDRGLRDYGSALVDDGSRRTANGNQNKGPDMDEQQILNLLKRDAHV